MEMGMVGRVVDRNLSLYLIAYLIGSIKLNHYFVYKGKLH